jgi:DNA polymerase-4
MPTLCRDCLALSETPPGPRCKACRSPRLTTHPELLALSIAHLDCDAFYASVEKRENPALRDRPVIIGGGKRGVVSTACYIARIRGVHSAQPMYQALKLCPDAEVIRPRLDLYVAVSRQIRALMDRLTPAVEPLSLDEAFLDLTGTTRLHHAAPAVQLARLAVDIERQIGVTVSVGLSHNKFLAKVASDLDKPRGLSLIGKQETAAFLAEKPVRLIWGVGPAAQESLAQAGIRTFADLQRWELKDLLRRFGSGGQRLYHLARGEDHRHVSPHERLKTISNETTFNEDTSDPDLLDGHIWRLAEHVSDRAKAKDLAGRTVTLKLKRHDFKLISRRHTLADPTQLADRLYAEARRLFDQVADPGPFRLIGVGLADITEDSRADLSGDLLDPAARRRADAERAADAIRARFGPDAIVKGRSLR